MNMAIVMLMMNPNIMLVAPTDHCLKSFSAPYHYWSSILLQVTDSYHYWSSYLLQGILFPADNIYKAFPNLSALLYITAIMAIFILIFSNVSVHHIHDHNAALTL